MPQLSCLPLISLKEENGEGRGRGDVDEEREVYFVYIIELIIETHCFYSIIL